MIRPQYNATDPVLDNGQFSNLRVDSNGKLLVSSEGTASIGDTDDPAWNGTDPNASVIALLKACYEQLVIIADNTAGA